MTAEGRCAIGRSEQNSCARFEHSILCIKRSCLVNNILLYMPKRLARRLYESKKIRSEVNMGVERFGSGRSVYA